MLLNNYNANILIKGQRTNPGLKLVGKTRHKHSLMSIFINADLKMPFHANVRNEKAFQYEKSIPVNVIKF